MMSPKKSWIGITLLLLVAVSSWPPVNAQVETTPSLVWTRQFVGTRPSGVTTLTGTYDRDGGTGSCQLDSQGTAGSAVQVDWLTGEVWVSYTDGNGAESGGNKNIGVVSQLSGSTGGTLGTFSQSAAFNVAACHVALDQHGRVYAQLGPCDPIKTVPSFVAATSNLTVLHLFEQGDICEQTGTASSTLQGVYTDKVSDYTTNGTRVSWIMSKSGVVNGREVFMNSSASDIVTYTETCRTTSTDPRDGQAFRSDTVWDVHVWDIATNTVNTKRTDTCAAGGSGTTAGAACVSGTHSGSATMNCVQVVNVPPPLFVMNKLDASDHSGAIAILASPNMPASGNPDPLDDGKTSRAVRMWKLYTDVDGNHVGCGLVAASDTNTNQYSFIAKWNGAWTTLLWNVTVQASGGGAVFTGRDCDLGASGEVLWAGTAMSGTSQAQFRKYCCSSAGIAGSQFIADFGQIQGPPAAPVTPGNFTGADFGEAIRGFAAAIVGDSAGSLFFFGFVLVLILFCVLAGASFALTEDGRVALLGGGIAALGTMVFCAVAGLWDDSATVILIMLTSAVILWLTKSLFLKNAEA